MTFDDCWNKIDGGIKHGDVVTIHQLRFLAREFYIAGQQDMKDTMDLPAIMTPVKVAWILCDNCEQYHEPDEPCALTAGSENRSRG